MRRISGLIGLLVIMLVAIGPAEANICAFDNAPAATLLFPFVTVDYNDPVGGMSSQISITNTSWQTQVVHVTVWTDFGESILDFNIILTGYDVIRFDSGQLFQTGRLPITLWGSHQTNEGVQDRGPMSTANTLNQSPGLFLEPPEATSALGDRCDPANTAYPGLYTTPIPPAFLNLFQGWLQVSQIIPRYYSDDCTKPFENPYIASPPPWWQTRSNDTPTWFYVTADVVENCNKLFPTDPGYFTNEARYDNVLVGDITWRSTGWVAAAPAVHIEADYNLGEVATTNPVSGFPVSFYHRYAAITSGVSDFREPLPTAWSMRYQGIGTDFIGTSFLAWKGSTDYENLYDLEATGSSAIAPDELIATNCLAYTYYAWDEDENVVTVTTPAVEINQLPLATQQVDAEEFQLPGSEGWVFFVWPPSNWTSAAAGPPDIWQTWMGSMVDYPGQGRVFMPAHPIANYGCFSDQVSPFYGIDYDYVGPTGYHTSPGNKLRPTDDQRTR